MKLWQLMSVLEGDAATATSIARVHAEWRPIGEWIENFGDLVRRQDRAKLDYVLHDAFVQACLDSVERSLFVSSDNWLRSWRFSPEDEEVSMRSAFDRYGGDLVEDVLEKGSAQV